MKAGQTGRRGWPLLSLGMVLGAWVLMRVALWETPFPTTAASGQGLASTQASPVPAMRSGSADPAPSPGRDEKPEAWSNDILRPPAQEPLDRPSFERSDQQLRDTAPRRGAHRSGFMGADRIIAHSMLLAAAYRDGAQDRPRGSYRSGAGPIAPGVVHAPAAAREFTNSPGDRWSMDLWALWREDTTSPLTSGRPSYGRSQVGAVLRYRLDTQGGHAPQLHLRATRALEGARENEVAAGVSARPMRSVPVRLAAEARVSETDRGTEVRAATYAVTELPPVDLPAGLRGETYLQGGYVTGEFATPFVDGQARVTRELAATENFRLTAGGGAWGGAQEDAERLDVGPTAGLSFRIGQAHGRISADYRFRVAGDAEPSSGPALTLSAGF